MDVFALLFILSFIALLVTLVVMSIRKRINKGKERTTKEVMELYFNIQLLFDIAKQEL